MAEPPPSSAKAQGERREDEEVATDLGKDQLTGGGSRHVEGETEQAVPDSGVGDSTDMAGQADEEGSWDYFGPGRIWRIGLRG